MCRICQEKGKVRCIFCGWKPKNRKRDDPPNKADSRSDWLEETKKKLSQYSMEGTGIIPLDEEIKNRKGPWK